MPPQTASYPQPPFSTATVLLIGSTGMGKSTLGNFLLDPDEEHMCENPAFAPGKGSRPMTQEVKVASKKVQIEGHGRVELTIIDTPGLNESPSKDLSHMIDIIKKLNECREIRACIFVVKFNAKIDAQYKATIKYYSKLLPDLFERNVIIVMTDFKTDKDSKQQRKRQCLNVEEVKCDTIDELCKCSNNQIKYIPQLFMIDCFAMYDEKETSKKERAAILDYIFELRPIKVKSQKVAKTDYIKNKDKVEHQKLQEEIKRKNDALKEDYKHSEAALNDTQKKKKEIDDLENDIDNFREALLDKNTDENVVAAHQSINVSSFKIESPYEITSYDTWTNGSYNFTEIVQTSQIIQGNVVGEFMLGIYASVTAYTHKKLKYQDEIKDLNDKIKEKQNRLNKCTEEWKKFKKSHTDKEEEIKLLEKYINERKAAARRCRLDFMTVEDAVKRLKELEEEEKQQEQEEEDDEQEEEDEDGEELDD
uniref:AIG1-type G domain-containing protein n=1 Tax=Amphimedon queenslandica TaxID=400682 RepID=A0A1X7STE0_AMPQE